MIEMLLSSSALILAMVFLRALLHRHIPARLQYALWLLVLIRLLVPGALYIGPVSVSGAASPVMERLERMEETRLSANETPTGAELPAAPAAEAPAEAHSALTPGRIARWVWAAGASVLAVWFLAANLRLALGLRRERRPYPGRHHPPVYVADSIPSPCLFGLIRPRIYLTERAAEDPIRAEQVIAHEQTHFRHGDTVWALLRGVCLVIWWFDPLVWLAAGLSRRDGELACDEGTIRRLGESARFEYGRTLLHMARVRAPLSELLSGASSMITGKSALRERVERIARRRKPSGALAALALILAVAAAGCSFAGAERTSGGEVFRQYYTQRAASDATHDYSHMDLKALDAMAVRATAAGVDTPELTIEVTGALVSGNTMEILLRVTAKQLDTVLRDGGGTAFNSHYRFGDETALLGSFTLNRDFLYLTCQYTYSDTDSALAPNQFGLHYWIVLREPLAAEPYVVPYWVETAEKTEGKPFILPLADFGYYENGRFVPLYTGGSEREGDWNPEIPLGPVSDTGKRLTVGKETVIGDTPFVLEEVQLTPLACTVRLHPAGDTAPDADFYSLLRENSFLTFSDGTRWGFENTDLSANFGGEDAAVFFVFLGPVNVEELTALTLPGGTFSLK